MRQFFLPKFEYHGARTIGCWLLFIAIGQGVELGEVDFTVLDAQTQEPIAARLRIYDNRGRAPRIRNVPRLGNDFSFRDLLTFKLRTGKYQFTLDRGPFYRQRTGVLEVNRDGFDQKTVLLPRFVNPREEGYYSGDVLITRDREALDILQDAEELDFAVFPTWEPGSSFTKMQAKQDRSLHSADRSQDFSASVCDTSHGRYLGAHLAKVVGPEAYPQDALGFATAIRNTENAHVSVLDPWAWDMPLLAANGLLDSIVVLGDFLQLDGDASQIKRGRNIDDPRYSGRNAPGRYAEAIYFHLLNCGFQIPPAAFSNSGDTKNPPGYNRVYVACGQEFSVGSWWRNLEKGRCVISNGPVLRVRVNDRLPGTVFRDDKPLQLEVTCDLATRQKVEYLEIIKNGKVLESVRLDKWAEAGGHLPIVTFQESGWLSVRVLSPSSPNYRVAMSAPVYVEINDRPTISAASAKFFKQWVFDRAKMLRKSKLPKPEQKRRIAEQKHAFEFFAALESRANAD